MVRRQTDDAMTETHLISVVVPSIQGSTAIHPSLLFFKQTQQDGMIRQLRVMAKDHLSPLPRQLQHLGIISKTGQSEIGQS